MFDTFKFLYAYINYECFSWSPCKTFLVCSYTSHCLCILWCWGVSCMHSMELQFFSCFRTAWFVSDNHSLTWISLILDSIVSIHSGLLVFNTIITSSRSITLFSISINFVKVIAYDVSFPIPSPWCLRLVWKRVFSESRLVLPLLVMYLELLCIGIHIKLMIIYFKYRQIYFLLLLKIR